ncbi:hypothetical protein ACHAW5_009050 [Stephanodiscus triporus]|uniref:Ribosomal protein mS38 C-terminal domain-containing protein n=1 Tax=Stephanodiscus triporus TaxID=2934178 RepID=A0ABD3PCE8_9STRA
MSLLRSAIVNAASRGGVTGSASSSTSAVAARTLSALSLLRSPSHRWRDDDDGYYYDAPSVSGMMLSSRGPPLPVSVTPTTTNTKIGASSLYSDATSRLASAIAASFGDWTFAATTMMDLSSKRVVEANDDVDGRGGDREDAAIFASASATTTITTTTESPQDDGGISSTVADLAIWLISTLKRRKKMMNKHKLRKRRKKLRLKTRK